MASQTLAELKHKRSVWWAGAALGAVAVALVAAWAGVWPGRGRAATGGNTLGNPPGMVDRLLTVDTAAGWAAGKAERVEVESGGSAGPAAMIRLARVVQRAYPRTGEWTSPEYSTPFPVTELVPSYNAHVPPDTGVRIDVQVRHVRGAEWSPWLYLGSWGRTTTAGKAAERVKRYARGAVHVDYLVLDRPADAFRVRVRLESFAADSRATPAVRRLSVSYSGVVSDPAERARLRPPPPDTAAGWVGDLRVPFRTQQDAPPALRGEICSPTSVSMVMAYWGVDRPTVENAVAIFDPETQIFGHWGRAVQRAGEMGLDAWLTRFRDWPSVRAELARGRPVIASIRFEKGEFPSAVMSETNGHLIVIRGFTPEGDVIVNDPASRKRGNGAVYRAAELARAWFDHGGVGYVIAGPSSLERFPLLCSALPWDRVGCRASEPEGGAGVEPYPKQNRQRIIALYDEGRPTKCDEVHRRVVRPLPVGRAAGPPAVPGAGDRRPAPPQPGAGTGARRGGRAAAARAGGAGAGRDAGRVARGP